MSSVNHFDGFSKASKWFYKSIEMVYRRHRNDFFLILMWLLRKNPNFAGIIGNSFRYVLKKTGKLHFGNGCRFYYTG
jgi:hypothetical protein